MNLRKEKDCANLILQTPQPPRKSGQTLRTHKEEKESKRRTLISHQLVPIQNRQKSNIYQLKAKTFIYYVHFS